MAFHDTNFPEDIAYGSRGGPGFKTTVISLADSGAEERITRWGGAGRRSFDAAYGVKTHVQLANLRTFYIARNGPAHSFRFRDFHDCTSTSTGLAVKLGGDAVANNDVTIATGDASEVDFQLKKFYSEGGTTRTRNITLPRSGTVLIAVNAVAQTEGVDYTVNYVTGVITFSTAPGNTLPITAGFEFEAHVRFSEEVDDVLLMSIDSYGDGSSSVPLIEVNDELATDDEYLYGGSYNYGNMSADITWVPTQGRTVRVIPQAAGYAVKLADETSLPDGGPLGYIINDSPTYTVDVEYDDATFVGTIAVDSIAVITKVADVWHIGVCPQP